MAAAGVGNDCVVYERGENNESDAWDDSVLIKAYDDAVSAMKARIAEQHPEFSPTVTSKPKKKRKSKGRQKKKVKNCQDTVPKWSSGDKCHAVYTEDGEVYEAKILSIDDENGTCVVQYIGYGNKEEQELSNLLPINAQPSSQDQLTDTASEAGSVGKQPSAQETIPNKQKSKNPPSASQQSHKRRQPQQSHPWFGAPSFPAPPFGHMPPPPPPPPPNFPPFQAPGYQASGPSMPGPPIFPSIPPPPPWFGDNSAGDENEALYSMLISWYMSGYHTGYYQGLKHASSSHGAQR